MFWSKYKKDGTANRSTSLGFSRNSLLKTLNNPDNDPRPSPAYNIPTHTHSFNTSMQQTAVDAKYISPVAWLLLYRISSTSAVSCATKNASEPYRRQRVAMRESSGFGSSSTFGGGDTTGDLLVPRSAAIFIALLPGCCGADSEHHRHTRSVSAGDADGSTQAMSGECCSEARE